MDKMVDHALFRCEECGAEWHGYRTAQHLASAHAKSTGHTVSGEVGYSVVYHGRTR